MTTLPTWALYAVSFGSPLLAFIGVVAGQYVPRKGAKELEQRSKREEVMRNLRWASELAVSNDPNTSRLGVAQLVALGDSDLLDAGQQLFVDAALVAVIEPPVEEITHLGGSTDVMVVQTLPPAVPSSTPVDGGND